MMKNTVTDTLERRANSLLILGAVLFAVGGHLWLIKTYGTVLPYRDPWQLTAIELLGPWLQGTLTWEAFFKPLNDHWPVLTRMLSFALILTNGQWNNLLEVVVNSAILGSGIAVFLRAIIPRLHLRLRGPFAVLAGLVFALPITWENTLWGIQSLPYFQILLSLLYLHLTVSSDRLGWRWTSGQVAGLLVLFTQHSAILAHVALLPMLAWRWYRRDGRRDLQVVSGTLALLVIAGFLRWFPEMEATSQYVASSVPVAAQAALTQLAWPAGHPVWALAAWIPWLILAFRCVVQAKLSHLQAFLIVVGLWVGGQAVAMGYGRGEWAFTHVSRYGDFLALGLLTNIAAGCVLLAEWWQGARRGWAVAITLTWLAVPVHGLWAEAVGSHTRYNLPGRLAENEANLKRVSDYILHGNADGLSLDGGGALLFSYPPPVRELLDIPEFRGLLPPETGAPEARSDYGRLAWLPQFALARPSWILGMGFLLLLGVSGWSFRRDRSQEGWSQARLPRPWNATLAIYACGAVGTVFAALWWTWPDRTIWSQDKRLSAILGSPSKVDESAAWEFSLESPHESDPSLMPGAVLSWPAEWRPFAFGTLHGGDLATHGIFATSAKPVESDYVSLIFSGFPCSPGNGLRWKLIPPGNGKPVWLPYQGPNPASGWSNWVEDLRAYQGWSAYLYLFDGRSDMEGWVGVMRPQFADDREQLEGSLGRLQIERTLPAMRVAGASAVVFWVAALGFAWGRRNKLAEA